MNCEEFDYVVGTGSAGRVLAARLTEDPNVTVCLLEAGGPDTSDLIKAPAAYVAMAPTKINNYAYRAIFEWKRKRAGLVTTTYGLAGAFIQSSPEAAIPTCS